MVMIMSICRINLWLEDIQITPATNEGKNEKPRSLLTIIFFFFGGTVQEYGRFSGIISRSFMIQKYLKNCFFRPILSYAFVTEQKSMNDIVGSKKMENGIVVFFMEKNEKKYESFNYAELVDMKINALDLLERPKSYKVDVPGHKLIVQK